MKIRNKKLWFLSSLLVAGSLTAVVCAPIATTISKSTTLDIKGVNQFAAAAANSSKIINNNTENPTDTSVKSYYTMSNSNDSYAILTSSTASQNGQTTTANQITKYGLFNDKQGEQNWVISDSTLKTDSGINGNLSIKAIKYASGPITSKGYLYVLVSDNTNAYLLKYDWATGQKATGNYKAQLNKDVNQFVILDEVNESILAFNSKKITANNTANTIDFYHVKSTDFNGGNKNGKASPKAVTKQTLTINQSLSSQHLENNMYLRDYKFVGGSLILAYQADDVVSNKKSHAIIRVKLNNGTLAESNLNSFDISSYSFSADDVAKMGSNKKISLSLVDKGDGKSLSVLVKAKTDASTNGGNDSILVSDFLNTNVALTTTRNDNYPKKGGYIYQIAPMYDNKQEIIGYLALDSTNSVIYLTKDLVPETIYAEFTSQKVYNIATSISSTDWFPQDSTDGTIGDYYKNTLIGPLNGTNNGFKEILADYSLFTDEQLNPSVKYKKIVSDGTNLDPNMSSYLNASETYKDFLTINSYDTRFPEPLISITPGTPTKSGDDYKLELTFKQQLRNKDATGKITNSGAPIEIGKYTYTFINSNGSIEQVTDKNKIPSSLLNLAPSKVQVKDVEKYLFKTKNVDGIKYTLSPDDTNGILNVTVNVPYMWENGTLRTGVIQNYSFGTVADPFFKKDPLASYDTSVSVVDSNYTKDDATTQQKEVISRLKLKYSTALPSEITPKDYLNDFLVLGAAYTNIGLINSGEIVMPTEDDIAITPIDKEGVAIVEVTFPKVGLKTNVKYSFETANVFAKNIYAHENFYFMFKDNEQVLNTKINENQTFRNYKATAIAANLMSAQGDAKKTELAKFATFSNYFGNLLGQKSTNGEDLVNILATGNDLAASLTLTITLAEPIPGAPSKQFVQTFTGFNTDNNNVVAAVSSFSFGELNATILSKSPSLVTEEDLRTANVFVYTGSASSLERTITLSPVNSNGSLEVSIVFKNWIEERIQQDGSKKKVIVPQKRFTRVYHGFASTADDLDMVVWKSYEELAPQYKTKNLPSEIVGQIISSTPDPVEQLQIFSTLTTNLQSYLTNNKNTDTQKIIEVNLSFNDVMGSISIVASILMNNKTQVFNSTISGFGTSTNEYGIIMVKDDSEAAMSLKNKLASDVNDTEIGKLYSLTSGQDLQKQITSKFDDTLGTLDVTVQLLTDSGQVIAENSTQYTGFVKNIPEYQGTNWLIFGLSVSIPIIIGLIPILFIKLYLDRRDIKKFNKKLDTRITEESKIKKSKKIKSIKDLLDR